MRSLRRASTAAPWAAGFLLALHLAPASPAAAADTKAFAFTSDFQTGSLSVANLATRAVSLDVASVGSDAVLRYFGGSLYVVNRYGGDNIQVIDPTSYATLRQFSVGNGSNPQDIVFVSSTKAYVSRYASATLLVVNPSNANGLPQSSISLAAFADGDGLPEMAHMIRIGRYVYVACQRLAGFAASNPSVVVVIDTQTDQVVDVDPITPGVQAIALTLRNPITSFEYDRAKGRLWIGCAGDIGVLDGGIEAIDPYHFVSEGTQITEAALGGDINDVAWHTASHAYALVGNGAVNKLVVWNPTTGLVTATPFTANGGFSLPDMEMNDRGELYVCKNPSPATSTDRPGLLVFSTATDALLAGPLNTGLPPICVTFDHATDAVLSVPHAPRDPAVTLSGPWPNPTRGSARIALRLGSASRVDATVVDLAGRVVRRMEGGAFAAGEASFVWDLRDDSGREVSAGLYFVRVAVDGVAFGRRLAVIR
jgi:DNA-binding beta-propeller fold protein YncE